MSGLSKVSMRIIRDLDQLEAPPQRAVVTIGNFDGVHLGHRELFRRLTEKAREVEGTSVVFTFVPHPLKVLAPEQAPRLINTHEEKERLIEASRVDLLICCPFDREMAALSAGDFVRDILVGKIGVQHLLIGYDYGFGRGREGDAAFLRRAGEELGFSVEVLSPVTCDGSEVYSSTRIRQAILAGEVRDVVDHLGRHFTLEGTVVHGDKRGTGLGFPTANLATEKEIVPRAGVYAVKVRLEERILDGVVNIGFRPTFRKAEPSLELHILDFDGDLYGRTLRIYFIDRLRDEKRFASASSLAEAIAEDVARARRILAEARIVEYRQYLAEQGDNQGRQRGA